MFADIWTLKKLAYKHLTQCDADTYVNAYADDRGDNNSSPCTSYRRAKTGLYIGSKFDVTMWPGSIFHIQKFYRAGFERNHCLIIQIDEIEKNIDRIIFPKVKYKKKYKKKWYLHSEVKI